MVIIVVMRLNIVLRAITYYFMLNLMVYGTDIRERIDAILEAMESAFEMWMGVSRAEKRWRSIQCGICI